jgi:hypothetical protein
MIVLKNSTQPAASIFASSRFSESKKASKGAIWFESSVHRLEDQGDEVYLTPEPPSERTRRDSADDDLPDSTADDRKK